MKTINKNKQGGKLMLVENRPVQSAFIQEFLPEKSKQYSKSFVKKYNQTLRYYNRVLPALLRYLPKGTADKAVLDLGCGNGMLLPYLQQRGYSDYIGVDISKDMISDAKKDYPDYSFFEASADDFIRKLSHGKEKFDVVISVMMLPAIGDKKVLFGVFKEVAKSLKSGGIFIANSTHPCFDPYMVQGSPDGEVKTDFSDYYNEGQQYHVTRKLSSGVLTFTDYHWTISLMVEGITQSGLIIQAIDECKDINDNRAEPSHLVYVLKKP